VKYPPYDDLNPYNDDFFAISAALSYDESLLMYNGHYMIRKRKCILLGIHLPLDYATVSRRCEPQHRTSASAQLDSGSSLEGKR